MKSYPRADRISGKIQRALSELLQKRVKDPRLEMATITGVKVSADLRIAHIYYTIFGSGTAKKEVTQGFQKSAGFIRRELARSLGLKYMPELIFMEDPSFEYGSKIDRILENLNDAAPEKNNDSSAEG